MERGSAVRGLFIVELRLRGAFVGVHFSPDERIEVSVYRFSREERNRLQYIKVKWYRVLEDLHVLKLGDKYVVPGRRLAELEEKFRELYREFDALRSSIAERLKKSWSSEEERLAKRAAELGIPAERLARLRVPDDPRALLELEYTVTPLPAIVEALREVSDEVERLARERDEYRMLAERIRMSLEAEKRDIEQGFRKRIEELEKEVEKLRGVVRAQRSKIVELAVKVKDVSAALEEVEGLVEPGSLEEMREKVRVLMGLLATRAVQVDALR